MIKWRGIVFEVHPLFVIVMLLSIVTGQFVELIILFTIVLWHELGHLAAALHFGWSVRVVKLLPFGGVVEVDNAGALPVREEIQVALAGPLQNGVLALVGMGAAYAGFVEWNWANEFIIANAMLAGFNLLPILPLDGGKIAQASLSLKAPYYKTLLWGARISLLFSALIVAASLYPLLVGGLLQLNLLAVGLFLCFSNWTYMRNIPFVFIRFLVHRNARSDARIEQGSLSRPIVISDQLSLMPIVRLLMKEQYHLIYVMKSGKIARVVPEKAVVAGVLSRLSANNADSRFFM